jgi:glycosyltransferase involved in cell wall biosynthesis
LTDLSIVAIIPLYNGARWIEQSIQTVLSQTRPPDEFIVVDDGSTDEGPAIVAKLAQSHPITLLHKPNGGQSSARNYGVAHSKSALIALLDQDDGWYPHHLETLIKPFRKPHRIPLGWVYSNIDLLTENGQLFCHDYLNDLPVEHPKRRLIRCFSDDMHILPSASLISRDAFESVGGFDERLSGYEDDDLFLRIFCGRWRNVYVSESLSFWRMTKFSASYSPRMAKSRMIYAHKLIAQFPDDRQRHMYFVRDIIAPKFFGILAREFSHAVDEGDRAVARRAINDMMEIVPHMRMRVRIFFSLATPFLRSMFLGRIILGATNMPSARKLVFG